MSDSTQQGQDYQDQASDSAVDPDILPMNFSALENLPDTIKPPAPLMQKGDRKKISFLYDVPFNLAFEVGRIDISIKELMSLRKGVVIDLKHVSVDSIDIRLNDTVLGYGEIIGLQQTYGVRFRELELMSQLKESSDNKQDES